VDGETRALDGYEIAARLSYMLWKSPPDEQLRAAADGPLATVEGITAQAARLLMDDRALSAVQDFYYQWIDGLSLSGLTVPESFQDSLRASAQEEVRSLVHAWFLSGSGQIQELFTTRSAYVDAELARFYGVEGVSAPGWVELPAGERSGLLTRIAFVGTHGPPPMRGDFVLNRVLCRPVPPPPVVPPDPTELGEFNTRREMFEAHAELACARGCHGILDPVGFPFEHYDELGRYRELDNGFPVNAATVLEVPDAEDVSGPVANAIELSERIATSVSLRACQAEHWFRYAYGRLVDPQDQCSLDELSSALAESDGEVRALLLRLTRTDAFRFVRKEAP
jgi:hypothetical protein